MKIHRNITTGFLAAAALALTGSAPIQAQTIITNTFTFTFATTGPTEAPFNTTWNQWYNTYNNVLATCDPTTDSSNPVPGANTSDSGSMMIISPLAGYTQNLFFGTFASNINNAYDFSVEANTLLYSSVSFDILVAPGTPTNSSGNYGNIGVGFINSGYGYEQITAGSVTIPASAATSWYHVVVPIDQTQGFGNVPGICLGLNSYGGYPLFTVTDWFDNISINGSIAPPPPPPTMLTPQTPIVGLNLIDTSPTANGDRYQVMNTNDNSGGLSFVGQSSVTYSWTIKEFPADPPYSYQAHFFIVSGSDNTNTTTVYPDQYDQAADYNLANCIFVTVQNVDTNGNGIMSFRYKTNEIAGNLMLFNTVSPTNTAVNSNGWPVQPVCTVIGSPLVGTWSLTFNGTTNVTMTSPSGNTNFVFDPASAALFADPVALLLGAQPNSVFSNQAVVYSSFSLTGTPAAYTDNFLTDTSLNTNFWVSFANDPNGVVLVPPGSAYWVPWTLPANSFGLFVTSNLMKSNFAASNWKSLASSVVIKNGPNDQALVASNSLPANGATTGYFTVISNTFSQLLVLLPGETNTPGVAPGYSGTPTPVSLSVIDGIESVTVLAVDSRFNPISGVTDTIAITNASGSDPSAILPNNEPMVNGSVTFNAATSPFFFQDEGSWTVTATDVTNPAITQGTSAAVTVGP